MTRGQVSVELLVVIGAILVLFIPLILITYYKASEATTQIEEAQAQVVATRLAEIANAVGSAGGASSVITEVSIPSNVKSVSVTSVGNGGEIVVHSIGRDGPSETAALVKFRLKAVKTFDFPQPGLVRFEISKIKEDGEDLVLIQKKAE